MDRVSSTDLELIPQQLFNCLSLSFLRLVTKSIFYECYHDLFKVQELQKKKMEANKLELESVRRRRIEREREKDQREKEIEMMQRDKEAEYYRTWEQQEDQFHLDQVI